MAAELLVFNAFATELLVMSPEALSAGKRWLRLNARRFFAVDQFNTALWMISVASVIGGAQESVNEVILHCVFFLESTESDNTI